MSEAMMEISGNLAADPELRATGKGEAFTVFRVAQSRRYKNGVGDWVDGKTNFWEVSAFDALGANAHASLRKGMPVTVYGRAKIDSWQSADGAWRSAVRVQAMKVGLDLTFGRASYQRISRAEAMGIERNDEETYRAEPVDSLPGGQRGVAALASLGSDARGEGLDSLGEGRDSLNEGDVEGGGHGSGAGGGENPDGDAEGPGAWLGNPETDLYEVAKLTA